LDLEAVNAVITLVFVLKILFVTCVARVVLASVVLIVTVTLWLVKPAGGAADIVMLQMKAIFSVSF